MRARSTRRGARSAVSTLVRLAYVSWVLFTYGVSLLLSKSARNSRWPGRLGIAPWSPARFCSLFEELGGTFIKFGQMLALQPDMIPIEYCNALFNLMDRVAPFDYAEVERTFIEDLGALPDRIF